MATLGLAATATASDAGPETFDVPESGSYIASNEGGAYIRNCPRTDCSFVAYVPNDTAIVMYCWQEAGEAEGNYSSKKWFSVSADYGTIGTIGWVHASLVARQTEEPRCDPPAADSNDPADWPRVSSEDPPQTTVPPETTVPPATTTPSPDTTAPPTSEPTSAPTTATSVVPGSTSTSEPGQGSTSSEPTPAAESTTTRDVSTTSSGGPSLPHTGFPAGVLALSGTALVALGVGLVRLRRSFGR
jgi:hypothetical protein